MKHKLDLLPEEAERLTFVCVRCDKTWGSDDSFDENEECVNLQPETDNVVEMPISDGEE